MVLRISKLKEKRVPLLGKKKKKICFPLETNHYSYQTRAPSVCTPREGDQSLTETSVAQRIQPELLSCPGCSGGRWQN